MGEVTPTMYLGMDGTGVPMRTQEVADRADKQGFCTATGVVEAGKWWSAPGSSGRARIGP
jgi:hypothetical protein